MSNATPSGRRAPRWRALVALATLPAAMLLAAPASAAKAPEPKNSPPQSAQMAQWESEISAGVNGERRKQNLTNLKLNPALAQVARDFSRRMAEEGFFSHVAPGGDDHIARLVAAKIDYRLAGENIMMATNPKEPPKDAMERWMASAGHRENILRPQFQEVGAGMWRKGDRVYFTLLLLQPPGRTEAPTAPAAPASLSAAPAASEVRLRWDHAGGEIGFHIDRREGSGSFQRIRQGPAGARAMADRDVVAGRSYTYRVQAYNEAGDSGFSNTVTVSFGAASAPPPAPTNLALDAVSTSAARIRWDYSGSRAGFEIFRRDAAGNVTRAGTVSPGQASTFTDRGLDAGTNYAYMVRAVNPDGRSESAGPLRVRTRSAA